MWRSTRPPAAVPAMFPAAAGRPWTCRPPQTPTRVGAAWVDYLRIGADAERTGAVQA
ncbi:hypothetical protein GCM10010282_67430 [Streptomyces roseolus]|nr:hypothetical protein GCM10010282_67430 [Streptomyces roseolus]